jgi:hypothetical protein
MPNGDKLTENEHFIPRMYLKNFSEVIGPDKVFIWQYNLKSMWQTPVSVNVKNVCFKKNLYEIMNEDGTFIAKNWIENIFGKIEKQTGTVIDSIIKKSQKEKCMNCTTVLSENDKSLIILFLTTLLYRDPKTIDEGMSFLINSNQDIGEREARNFTLMNLLPLGIDSEWDKNTIIRTAVENLSGMAFQIGIANEDVIITSDRPFVFWSPYENELYNRPKAVAFPLTSRLVLYLFPVESVAPLGRNCFFRMREEQVCDIQTNVAVCAKEWIYSRKPLTKEQIERIKDARCRLL